MRSEFHQDMTRCASSRSMRLLTPLYVAGERRTEKKTLHWTHENAVASVNENVAINRWKKNEW